MSSFFAAATAAVWGTSTTPEPHDPSDVTAHINPKHATPEEIEKRVDALGTALASTEAPALLRKGGEPGLLPAAPDAECAIDRATLRRWLVAEKLDVASAASRLEKHAHWRADYVPTGRIEPSEVAEELALDKVFIQPGLDASGRPVVVISVAKHHKNGDAAVLARLKRFICWVFDVAIAKATGVSVSEDGGDGGSVGVGVGVDDGVGDAAAAAAAAAGGGGGRGDGDGAALPLSPSTASAENGSPPPRRHHRRPSKPPGDGKVTAIFDLRGASMDNMDVAGLKQIFGLLQSHFPERLGRMVFLDPPAIFWGVWRIVSPFVDPVTRAKVVMASTRDLARGDIVPLDVLPLDMGGRAPARSVVEAAREHGLLPHGVDVAALAAEVAERRERSVSRSVSASSSPEKKKVKELGEAAPAGEGSAAEVEGATAAAAAAVAPAAAPASNGDDYDSFGDEDSFDDAPSAIDDDEDQDDEAAIAALDEALQRELRVVEQERLEKEKASSSSARSSSHGGDENAVPGGGGGRDATSSSASAAACVTSSSSRTTTTTTTASFSGGGKVTTTKSTSSSVVTAASTAVVRE